jgi:hypothetical protein
MDTAWYIRMTGTTGEAVLIDRDNLGERVFERALKRLRATSKPGQPLMWSFVNCTLQFVDQYIKVSDDVPVDTLLTATGVRTAGAGKISLYDAWQRIIDSRYFGRLGSGPAARLGDGTRRTIMPDGRRVIETQVSSGEIPGAEYMLPMVVGAHFKITITPTSTQGSQVQDLHMRFEAEYAGSGVNMDPTEKTFGVEEGDFRSEGNAFVSFGRNRWTAGSCGSKNGMVTPEITFDRVVLGVP